MARSAGQKSRPLRMAVFGITLIAVAACTSVYRKHGYVPPDEDLAEIVIGVDTRDSIAESVGVPSSEGVLSDSGFYYIATRFRHYGAREPEVVDRKLVAITFDNAGIVRNIESFGLERGRVVPLVRRISDSSVRDQTFLRQLLGNLSNFNPSNFLDQ